MRKEFFSNSIDIGGIDTLRSESESVSPSMHKVFSQSAEQGRRALESFYGRYMHPGFIGKNQTVVSRIIVIEDMGSMYERWSVDPRLGLKSVHGKGELFGLSLQVNGLIYIQDPNTLWDLTPDLAKETYALVTSSSMENAKTRYIKEFSDKVTTHEMIHQYQDPTLEEGFSEMSAEYYQRKIKARFRRKEKAVLSDPEISAAYSLLLSEFGADVHKLSFGSLKSSRRRKEILDRAREEWWMLAQEGIVPFD